MLAIAAACAWWPAAAAHAWDLDRGDRAANKWRLDPNARIGTLPREEDCEAWRFERISGPLADAKVGNLACRQVS
jgi:hypothetical protein